MRYMCSVRQKLSVASLFHDKMRKGESIRKFMKCFGAVILQLESVTIELIMQAVKETIQPNTPFFASLSLDPPGSVDELLQHANQYVMLEDEVAVASKQSLTVPRTDNPSLIGPTLVPWESHWLMTSMMNHRESPKITTGEG